MKNIHLIATDKPTGIFQSNSGLQFSIRDKVRVEPLKGFHIYITSNEDIKIGNWVLNIEENTIFKPSTYEIYHIKNSEAKYYEYCKKIILSTDPDLIKDGVQAIDDEFLEWFVNNPSCEFVEVEDYYDPKNMVYGINTNPYKITIPKEEAKQETVEQTAVEWLVEYFSKYVDMNKHLEEIEQAKEMEKQQIIDAYRSGKINQLENSELYYNETFKQQFKNK
jgi:hypothetical protein